MNYSTSIRYGLIGGIVASIIGVLSYMFYRQLFGGFMSQMLVGFFYLGIMVFIPVWGTVSQKREQGNLTFQQGFISCTTILAITLLFSSVTGFLIPNIIDKDYPAELHKLVQQTTAESMEKFGAPDEKIEETLDGIKIEDFKPSLMDTVQGYAKSLGIGAILSVLVALFVSRPNRHEQPKPVE